MSDGSLPSPALSASRTASAASLSTRVAEWTLPVAFCLLVRGHLAPAERHGRRRHDRRSRTSPCWRPRSRRRPRCRLTPTGCGARAGSGSRPSRSSRSSWPRRSIRSRSTASTAGRRTSSRPRSTRSTRCSRPPSCCSCATRGAGAAGRDGRRSRRSLAAVVGVPASTSASTSSARGRRAGGSRRSSASPSSGALGRPRSRSASWACCAGLGRAPRHRSPRSSGGTVCVVLSGGIAAELAVVLAAVAAVLLVLRAGRRELAAHRRRRRAHGRLRPRRARAPPRRPRRSSRATSACAKADESTNRDAQTFAQRELMYYLGIRVWLDKPMLGAGWQSIREQQVYEPFLRRRAPALLRPARAGVPARGRSAAAVRHRQRLHPGARRAGRRRARALPRAARRGARARREARAAGAAGAGAARALVGVLWLLVAMGTWAGQGLVRGCVVRARCRGSPSASIAVGPARAERASTGPITGLGYVSRR